MDPGDHHRLRPSHPAPKQTAPPSSQVRSMRNRICTAIFAAALLLGCQPGTGPGGGPSSPGASSGAGPSVSSGSGGPGPTSPCVPGPGEVCCDGKPTPYDCQSLGAGTRGFCGKYVYCDPATTLGQHPGNTSTVTYLTSEPCINGSNKCGLDDEECQGDTKNATCACRFRITYQCDNGDLSNKVCTEIDALLPNLVPTFCADG